MNTESVRELLEDAMDKKKTVRIATVGNGSEQHGRIVSMESTDPYATLPVLKIVLDEAYTGKGTLIGPSSPVTLFITVADISYIKVFEPAEVT